MWWAALLAFKYIIPQRLKRDLIVPVWTMFRDLSCVPSGALAFFCGCWSVRGSQSNAGCEIHAECPPLWGQLNGGAVLSLALIFFSSFHSTVKEIQGEKKKEKRKGSPAMTNVTCPQTGEGPGVGVTALALLLF